MAGHDQLGAWAASGWQRHYYHWGQPMTPLLRRLRVAHFPLLFTALAAAIGAPQIHDGTFAAEIVERLTYQPERSGGPGLLGPECVHDLAMAEQDRQIAVALVQMGAQAVASMEAALDALEKGGPRAGKIFDPAYLFYAYATARGSAAYPRLRRMIRDERFLQVQFQLDTAVAIALGLTSYVDDSRQPIGVFFCRNQEPRDALDSLILAWETGDEAYLASNLGPSAQEALKGLLNGTNFAEVRAGLWPSKAQGVAVGYRLIDAGAWAEPPETLDEGLARRRSGSASIPVSGVVEFNVDFRSPSGAECGQQRLRFLRASDLMFRAGYVVDNSNLRDLLRLIGLCAAKAD